MMPWLGRDYVPRNDDEALQRQTRRFRMWRPWMWGPLAACWQIHYEQSTVDTLWGPHLYLWKGRHGGQ